ncbi:BatA domain-containing protein [Ichthyenterobacterium sp. W332]|uniref:BatA domain-containing protein n=1 Tax=Microcosmobacter mediterraneus TaxID=3075607 RepID=A0ABU2YKM6_9FLAO|nr:BatA domain-containing protein [Ichthyenterobacterium sp. W332]MDT0558708.1 BatA domain-containing protein [Ichthyenterobacterium sp. W332]
MQFKHPEILYALLLLIIPIIVHLFQLRRFQKEEFTNVKFLKTVVMHTRKSSQLKKWLTLLARLGLLACAIIAFAQPFFSNSDSFNTKSETVIYLDNSFSMQAKGKNGTLLNEAIQGIFESIPDTEDLTLFTNNETFKNTTLKSIRNDLITLKYSPTQLNYQATELKGRQLFSEDESTFKNLVLISDFQQQNEPLQFTADSIIKTTLIPLEPNVEQNVSIDSVFISKTTIENIELTVDLSAQGALIDNLSVALYNSDQLVAKSSLSIEDKTSSVFTIPANTTFEGKVTIEESNLSYDNTFYFSIGETDLIKVISINEADDSYLKRIYTNDEFIYSSYDLKDLNYNTLSDQDLIILNELNTIPNALITTLNVFKSKGGSFLIIPSEDSDLNSYNQLFSSLNLPRYSSSLPNDKRITTINFSHPLLENVFDKTVDNFQYPKVSSFYPTVKSVSSASVLQYEDGSSFLTTNKNAFVFTSALNSENSNFKSSPLIVPVLYNIAKQSLQLPELYYSIGKENTIDIKIELQQDDILKLAQKSDTNSGSIIPLQRTYPSKVELTTNNFPDTSGWYSVLNNASEVKQLSYNYNRSESKLNYYNLSLISNVEVKSSIATAINDIKSATNVNELWKWFVIFALAFLLIELLLLKYLK